MILAALIWLMRSGTPVREPEGRYFGEPNGLMWRDSVAYMRALAT